MLPLWLTAEASTLCAGKATGLLDTLQPALIVSETPRVVVAVPACAGLQTNTAEPSKSSPTTARREVHLTVRVMCYHPKGSDVTKISEINKPAVNASSASRKGGEGKVIFVP